MARKNVVIGLVGSTLDAGLTEKRWTRWRPSVAICQQPDFRVDRFELLVQPEIQPLATQVMADIARVSPHTEVRPHVVGLANPWDFSDVYAALDAFAEAYPWRATEDYYLHITTGTHVVQICLFLLCETRAMPAVLLQASPVRRTRDGREAAAPRDAIGRVDVIDLQLEKFDRLAARFRARRASGASLLKAGIDTRNAKFNAMIEELEHVASRSRDPLLLVGETGTGKTALCQRLHELKRIRQHLAGELVAVNCATLRGDLAMSVLFGHAKGAFTGAADARTGLLRKGRRRPRVPRRDRRARPRRAGDAAHRDRGAPVLSARLRQAGDERLPARRRHQPRPRRGRARRPVPRGPARADRAVDVPHPGAARAPRGPRAEPRLRARADLRRARRRASRSPGRRATRSCGSPRPRRGARTSATSTRRSAAWPRSPTAAASTRRA